MLNNITKREKFLVVLTAAAALVALAYNFVIEPLANRWSGLEKEIREKEALLIKHRRIARDKDAIERLYSEYSKYFKHEKLSDEEESALALSSIEKLARGANAHITNIKPLAVKEFDNYRKFTFRVTAESKIDELAKFVYELQASEQLLKIDRMVLRAKERSRDVIKAVLHVTKISVF